MPPVSHLVPKGAQLKVPKVPSLVPKGAQLKVPKRLLWCPTQGSQRHYTYAPKRLLQGNGGGQRQLAGQRALLGTAKQRSSYQGS